jgi:hypothetical protein
MYFTDSFARKIASHVAENPDFALAMAKRRARRVELNRLVRQNTAAMNSIPALANKSWARRWRSAHQSTYRSAIRRYQRELDLIEKMIGPAPEFFKPRPVTAAERKIARRYDPAATPTIYWRAWRRLAQLRAAA